MRRGGRRSNRRGSIAIGTIACACALVVACGFTGVGEVDATAGGESGVPGEGSTGDASGSDSPSALDATNESILIGDGASCLADLATDPLNCGRCTHSCDGAPCAAGICQPVTLATATRPHELTVDATDVYWTDRGTGSVAPGVARCLKAGGAVVAVATGNVGTNAPTSIAVQSGRVLFTDPNVNMVISCGLPGPGCADQQTSSESGPQGITTNGAAIFWVNGNSGNVRRADASLGNAQTIAQNQVGLSRIAANATTVFFTLTNGLGSAPVGGPAMNLFLNGMNPRDLAIDGTYVYVAYATAVYRFSYAFGSQVTVATGLDIQRLAVDASGIYFTDRGGGSGSVLRCPLAGCTAPQTPDVLATGETMPFGIALDASHVYWANEPTLGGGTVRRVAK